MKGPNAHYEILFRSLAATMSLGSFEFEKNQNVTAAIIGIELSQYMMFKS